MVQEVDRVVARLRARENEQHNALVPVQACVNTHTQASVGSSYAAPLTSTCTLHFAQ